jgi:hypothetical protein
LDTKAIVAAVIGSSFRATARVTAFSAARQAGPPSATEPYLKELCFCCLKDVIAAADGGPACLAAEKAVTRAVALNEDPITAATIAFVSNSPAAPADDPCANAAAAYVAAISEGSDKENAFTAGGKGFLSAFQVLESKGKSLFDGACGEAAMAFLSTAGSSSAADIDNITKYFKLFQ